MTPFMWLAVTVIMTIISVFVFGFVIARLIANQFFDTFNFECPNCQEVQSVVCGSCQADRLEKGFKRITCKKCHSPIYNVRCSCGYRADWTMLNRFGLPSRKI